MLLVKEDRKEDQVSQKLLVAICTQIASGTLVDGNEDDGNEDAPVMMSSGIFGFIGET